MSVIRPMKSWDVSIYLLLSDTSFSPETYSKGECSQKSLHISLSIHSLLTCSILPTLSATLLCMHVLIYTIITFYNQSSPLPGILNFTYTISSETLHSPFSQDGKTTSKYFFSYIALHHTPFHLHKFPCHIFHTHFHCSHPPLVILHASLN